jgi:hypothetical protein
MDVKRLPVRMSRVRSNSCPACGPVATEATSRYCPTHLAVMRLRLIAIRGGGRETLRPAA